MSLCHFNAFKMAPIFVEGMISSVALLLLAYVRKIYVRK